MYIILCRLLLEDGSGEAHLYIDNELVPQVLLVPTDEWRRLVQSVQTKGSLVYIKQKHSFVSLRFNYLLLLLFLLLLLLLLLFIIIVAWRSDQFFGIKEVD